jgi:hypothetical protein
MNPTVFSPAVLYRVKVPLRASLELQETETEVLPKGALLERLSYVTGLMVQVRRNGKTYLVREEELLQRCERVAGHGREHQN